jgi:hypothetical protein
MDECLHEFEFDNEEVVTQLENIVRLTKFVRCRVCGQEAMDVFVYIGTFPRDEVGIVDSNDRSKTNVLRLSVK